MKNKNVVVMGGGTGTYTVLTGLKKYRVNLTAIVSMADEGGSTGILRDELGVLPPGDVRQCLVALSSSDLLMRELMNYRFQAGGLKGHSFGNLLLSALEKVTGSFDAAVEKTAEILRLKGSVIPITLEKTRLVAYFQNGKVIKGEDRFHSTNFVRLKSISLQPRVQANPKALAAIHQADVIVIGPGDFYSSLVPNLLVQGISGAICKSKAKKIYVCNLMTKAGHTDGWSVLSYLEHMEQYLGCPFDYIVYNNKHPETRLLRRYARKGERLVQWERGLPKNRFLGADFISKKFPKISKSDVIKRSLIRHNSDRLAEIILHPI